MTDPEYLARRATFEEFLAECDPTVAPRVLSSRGSTALFGALTNPDPHARVAIANRLLDDGVDATAIDAGDSIGLLHALWSTKRARDIPAEATLVGRLLDAGTDIDHVSPRFGPPLHQLIDAAVSSLEYLLASWDAVVAHSRPDLTLVVDRNGKTLARRLDVGPLRDRLHRYLSETGHP